MIKKFFREKKIGQKLQAKGLQFLPHLFSFYLHFFVL